MCSRLDDLCLGEHARLHLMRIRFVFWELLLHSIGRQVSINLQIIPFWVFGRSFVFGLSTPARQILFLPHMWADFIETKHIVLRWSRSTAQATSCYARGSEALTLTTAVLYSFVTYLQFIAFRRHVGAVSLLVAIFSLITTYSFFIFGVHNDYFVS